MVIINLTGTILKNRYCIMEELGSGGEGHLYLARDMELGNYWAVKELPIAKKREAKLLRLLEYPSIPKMVDYVEKEDYCYLVMEYIRGKSLGKLCEEGRVFSPEELLNYGDTILQVLEYLHEQKPPVYYGDLKPDNLMLSDSGRLYLVDFGSAMFGFGNNPRICMGTEGFAAPEQYEGKISCSSDLYALGKTLHMLAGKNWLFILWKIPGFLLFIHRCTQAQETKRFQSAAQARKMLQNIGKRKGIARKNTAIVIVTAGVLLLSGLLFGGQEKSFEKALSEVTEVYYESEKWSLSCKQLEAGLQKLQKEYTKDEEQRKILLLLAANAELEKEWARAAVYYEQLLLYAPEYAEGYGKYGLFLLRRGQTGSSRRLFAAYKQSGANGNDCRSIQIWEKQMEEVRK